MPPTSKQPRFRFLPSDQIGDASDEDLKVWGLDPILDYWNKLRGDRFAPRWEDFDLMDLPAHVRGGMVVVDYDRAKNDFRVRFWGVDLWDVFGIDLTGKWLSQVRHTEIMARFLKYGIKIIDTKQVQKTLHWAETTTGERETYPVLRLPLSDDGVNVTNIITLRNAKLLGRRR
jgi:hypothetical protein